MDSLSLSDSVTPNPDVICRVLEGEAVLLRLDAGIYYGLDPVGTRIWELIGELGALRLVFEAVRGEYDVDEEPLERDLLQLVADLCANGLGTVSASSDR